MSNIQVLDKVGNLIPTKTTIPLDTATGAFNRLLEAHNEYKKIAIQEKTKREAIDAWKDIRLTELNNQKEVLRLYLDNIFKERQHIIDGLFETLDKGIETNSLDIIDKAITGIVTITKDSPLQQVDKLMLSLKDESVKAIEF